MLRWLLTALLMIGAAPAHAEESCVTCHPDVKTDYDQSIHAKHFSCTACHGGDPSIVSQEAHAVAKQYIGKPLRKNIPALCASCHADTNRMQPYHLQTDQYAQYQQSRHGVLLQQGDDKVAVCSDCHSAHRIVPRDEPTSPVAARNIPDTCGRCHADATLMAPYKLPTDQVEKFKRSVHGVALLVEEHPAAPSCVTCHGAHGAVAPQMGTIRTVCGHCHARTAQYLDQGPHGKAADEGKLSECVSCHGYHDTAEPDLTLFDTACPACHAADTPGFTVAQKLKTVLSQANDALQTADADIVREQRMSPLIVRLQPRLNQGWAYFREALPVQHALALDRVGDLTRSARSISEEVQSAVHGASQERQIHYLFLALAWIFILLAMGVTYLYRRERARRRGAAPDS
ncbi:MAG TPA: hypothetical protein VMW17_06645 [Candidatus Binatia bacterium]|nr:hypothetical protein [Candidatus Binatia bacterium]